MFERLLAVLKNRFEESLRWGLFVIPLDVLAVLMGAKASPVTPEPCAIGAANAVVKVMPRVGVDQGHGPSVCKGLFFVKTKLQRHPGV